MSANEQTKSSAACGCAAPDALAADINASCRWPVLTLFLGAAQWLVISSALALITSIKFHAPGFLADCPLLTYGRVHPAQLHALAYGFAAQAGLGFTLWLLAQSGKTRLALPAVATVAAHLWNLGVLVGVGGILTGHTTGFEWFEMPRAAVAILAAAYLLLALAGGLTFARRTDRSDVSQWFALGALLWFAWIFATAAALLGCAPVRGITQEVVAWWFANNFLHVWLSLLGLGVIFHLAPKFSGRPLHSRALAIFAFWILTLFGSWAGIPAAAPLPVWFFSVSAVGAFMGVVGILAVLVNLKQTCGQCLCVRPEPAAKFLGLGVWALALSTVATAATASARIGNLTDFTWFTPALAQLQLYGFFAPAAFGAIYHIAPQLTRTEYFCLRPVKIHFWLWLAGLLLLAGPLAVGGIVEGRRLNDAAVTFLNVVKATLPFLRASTLGDLFILLGSLLLVVNLGGLLFAAGKKCCAARCAGETQTAEVAK